MPLFGRYGHRTSESRSSYLPSFPLIPASPILVHCRRSSSTQYKFIKQSVHVCVWRGSCGACLTGLLRDLVFLDRSDHAFGFQEEAGRTGEQSLHSAHCWKSLVPHSLHAEKKASSSNKNPPVKLGCNAKSRMFSRIPSDSRLSI